MQESWEKVDFGTLLERYETFAIIMGHTIYITCILQQLFRTKNYEFVGFPAYIAIVVERNCPFSKETVEKNISMHKCKKKENIMSTAPMKMSLEIKVLDMDWV